MPALFNNVVYFPLFGLFYKLLLKQTHLRLLFEPFLAIRRRHVPHHSSLWSSLSGRWLMPIKVRIQIWMIVLIWYLFTHPLCSYSRFLLLLFGKRYGKYWKLYWEKVWNMIIFGFFFFWIKFLVFIDNLSFTFIF